MSAPRDVDALDATALEELAREIVEDGLGSRELTSALDQLVADRTNGEPLDAAIDDLRAVLARGVHRRGVWQDDTPGTERS